MVRRALRASARERRLEILAAAQECFGEAGYHETRVDEIARRAGLSKGAIYWHFDGKREIFLALVDRYVDAFSACRDVARDSPTAQAGLRKICGALLRSVSQTRPMTELTLEYMAQAGRDEDLRVRFGRLYGLLGEVIAEQIRRGVEDGGFRAVDVDRAASVLVAALDGLLFQKLVRRGFNLERAGGQALDLFIRGLEAA